jgi:nucleoside-diphosphate-sugar epimerase
MKHNVIITGASGMIGEAVLLECLESDTIVKVLLVNRGSTNRQHPKLEEVLLKDFTNVASVKEQLNGYGGCFFCMGTSAVGKSEAEYTEITYDTVAAFADILFELNPKMVFNYVSGQGTDSTEKGTTMWARVKGKAENKVLNKGFNDAYAFRIGVVIPEKGIKSRTNWYQIFYSIMRPFYSLLKKSKNITTTTKVGLAMINSLTSSSENKHLENKEINQMAGF